MKLSKEDEDNISNDIESEIDTFAEIYDSEDGEEKIKKAIEKMKKAIMSFSK